MFKFAPTTGPIWNGPAAAGKAAAQAMRAAAMRVRVLFIVVWLFGGYFCGIVRRCPIERLSDFRELAFLILSTVVWYLRAME